MRFLHRIGRLAFYAVLWIVGKTLVSKRCADLRDELIMAGRVVRVARRLNAHRLVPRVRYPEEARRVLILALQGGNPGEAIECQLNSRIV